MSQRLEHAFAQEVEKPLSDILHDIRGRSLTASLGVNDYFISEEGRAYFSSYLTLQYVRTKRTRESISELSSRFTQALADMGMPKTYAEKYHLSERDAKSIHISLLLDKVYLNKIAARFRDMIWILLLNSSHTSYYTTDSPIVTYGHVKDPFFSTSGIASRSVEVFCPLSPYTLLIMLERSYHTSWLEFDRRCIEIDFVPNVYFYNQLLAINAERAIFSSDGNFDLVHKMISKDPSILKQPLIHVGWGNNEYYSRNKRGANNV